jgi:hypothetical protein
MTALDNRRCWRTVPIRAALLRATAAVYRGLPGATSVLFGVVLCGGAVVAASHASAGKPACRGNSCHKSPTATRTLRSGATGLPRSDSTCAALVPTSSWEPRTDNATANNTMPADPSAVPWAKNSATTYWTKSIAKRKLVTQWAGCKWGISGDLLRAVAARESDWHMSAVGDACGPTGEASYGLFQVKNAYCDGGIDHGGYPYTAKDTALNADFYAMNLRSCLDGDFNDGGSWLYGGKTITQIISTNGLDYALWGCVGSWYSGGWYDSAAKTYIGTVKTRLAAKTWLSY